VLVLLAGVSVSNYLDRAILGILQQPIKQELGLTDLQLGWISGPAFALFYASLGIPIARWAERGPRVTILALCLAVWSTATALCGSARNYLQLALCRMGVGLGEAGCTPVTHSLLSDYFPPWQRGMAMALLMTSVPCGQFLGALIGGVVADLWSWRTAFLLVGAPGLLLAAILRLTVKEPVRGVFDPAGSADVAGSFKADLGVLLRIRPLRNILAAGATLGIGLYGVGIFIPAFFLRSYQLSLAGVGAITAVGIGGAALVGTLVGGYLSDRYAGASGRSYMMVPLVGALGYGAFLIATFNSASWVMAFALLIVANIFGDLKNGPVYAAVQNIVRPRMRATAAALNLFCINAIGLGLGPPLVGAVSDRMAGRLFPDTLGEFALRCSGEVATALDGGVALAQACATASAAGLRWSLVLASCWFFVAAVFYWRASRAIRMNMSAA
jgi:predicted MFS family arabinose efflux permease